MENNENRTTPFYKISISIIFGILGFAINFHTIKFPFPPYIAVVLIGLLFPMLITLSWGWKYGFMSALTGGCQSMWWLWGPSNGYAIFFVVPPFTLWIIWHGFFALLRKRQKKPKWWLNKYIIEIPFRLLSTINLLTLSRWAITLNPPSWTWALDAPNTIPMHFSNFIVIKQAAVGYIILLLSDVLLNIGFVRRFFRLKEVHNETNTGYIISASLLIGALFWLIDSIFGSLVFHTEKTFLELFALNVPSYNIFIRTAFILSCLVGGLLAAKLLRKQRESDIALKESEEQFRFITEKMADIVWTLDLDFKTTYVSPSIKSVLGFTPEERKRQTIEEMITPESLRRVQMLFLEELAKDDEGTADSDRFVTNEVEFYHRDGSTVWSENIVKAIRDLSGSIIGFHGVSRDITERKRAEADSERLLAAIEQAGETIITDSEGNIQYTNPAFERITGYSREEVVGENPRILKSGEHDKSFYRQMWQTITAGDTWRGSIINRKKDGTFYTTEASISPVLDGAGGVVNFVAVKRDITDEIRMKEKLRQAQKMESIGTLAGGIAHDFNNILFPMVGYAEMLKLDLPADSPLHGHVDEILNAALRSKDLVKQILAFSRQSDQDIKPIKLQPIVKEATKLLRSSIPTIIDIQQDIDPDCGVVVADPTQVHQIVMNLATNAYHAMEKTGGRLNVNLKQVRLESDQVVFPELTPGEYAILTVRDTGVGIEKDIMDKILDPYFTTKETGKGTGLGLSVVQGIVKSCNGEIRIYSEPGKGTKIQVYLPIMDRKVGDIRTDRSEQPIRGGTEKILLVDDEEAIIRMEQQMLERLGYIVTTRTGSVDALEAFKANPGSFNLVVTDMTMPNMTGVQLAGEVKKIRPDIPVILCTGFSYQINDEKSKALGIQGFVMKPVVMRELAETIRKVLDNSEEG